MAAVLLRTTSSITGLNLSFTKISAAHLTIIMSAAVHLNIIDFSFTRLVALRFPRIGTGIIFRMFIRTPVPCNSLSRLFIFAVGLETVP